MPGAVAAVPSTAASSPRLALTSSDSCGLCMAGVASVSVRTGREGSLMSSTATPVCCVAR